MTCLLGNWSHHMLPNPRASAPILAWKGLGVFLEMRISLSACEAVHGLTVPCEEGRCDEQQNPVQ